MRDGRATTHPERTARLLKRAADSLCYARIVAGPVLGAYIARQSEYRSWKTAGLIGLVSATDALDGKLARQAVVLDPTTADQRGAWLDQIADKIFTHAILGGMAINALRRKQFTLAGSLVINQAAQLERDVWVTSIRRRAHAHDVPTNAQGLGKIKTGALLASTIAMASPLSIAPENDTPPIGQIVSSIGLSIGTGLAVASGISLSQSLEAGIAASEQQHTEKQQSLFPEPYPPQATLSN